MAVLLILVLLYLFWQHRLGSKPISSGDGSTPRSVNAQIHDPLEDLVYDIDASFDEWRYALEQMDEDQCAEIFHPAFLGPTVFDPYGPTQETKLPHIVLRRRQESSPPSLPLPHRIREFFKPFQTITAATIKIHDAVPIERNVRTTYQVTVRGRTSTGRREISEHYEALLSKEGRKWILTDQKRLDGRSLECDFLWFSDITHQAGLEYKPALDCRGCAYKTPLIHLGGVAAGDFNNDGWIDLFLPSPGASRLFENRNGRFTDRTSPLGLGNAACAGLWFDFDNDGRLDLAASNLCPSATHCMVGCAVRLYRNEGDRFVEVTRKAGMNGRGNAYSMAAADFDCDGDLDLFVCRYGGSVETDRSIGYGLGTESFLDARNGEPDLLFRNNGDGTFSEVAASMGVADMGWGLACVFTDLNEDDYPDLYVVNDFGRHTLYLNQKGASFVKAPSGEDHGFGMGVTVGDVNGDGRPDLYVSNMYSTAGKRILQRETLSTELAGRLMKAAGGNALLVNGGGGVFVDQGQTAGVAKAGWAWGCVACDTDNDGWTDLYVANGFMSARSRADL